MCAAGTLCDSDTTICQNVGCAEVEHLEMWVIINLGSLFVRKEIYIYTHIFLQVTLFLFIVYGHAV